MAWKTDLMSKTDRHGVGSEGSFASRGGVLEKGGTTRGVTLTLPRHRIAYASCGGERAHLPHPLYLHLVSLKKAHLSQVPFMQQLSVYALPASHTAGGDGMQMYKACLTAIAMQEAAGTQSPLYCRAQRPSIMASSTRMPQGGGVGLCDHCVVVPSFSSPSVLISSSLVASRKEIPTGLLHRTLANHRVLVQRGSLGLWVSGREW
jgi:hypothetical protein